MQDHKIREDKIKAVLEDNFFFKKGPKKTPPTTYFELLTKRERAALELAERMTDIHTNVTDEFYDRIKGQFNKYEYALLVAAISFMNLRTKYNAAMGVHHMSMCSLPEVVEECEKAISHW